jgi:hypothetical protein
VGRTFFSKEVADITQDLDQWPELKTPKPLSMAMEVDSKCESVLIKIRNALAHGNIFTLGSPIEQIIFVSKPPGDTQYSMHAVTPDIFRRFLENWFSFLNKEGLIEDNTVD